MAAVPVCGACGAGVPLGAVDDEVTAAADELGLGDATGVAELSTTAFAAGGFAGTSAGAAGASVRSPPAVGAFRICTPAAVAGSLSDVPTDSVSAVGAPPPAPPPPPVLEVVDTTENDGPRAPCVKTSVAETVSSGGFRFGSPE